MTEIEQLKKNMYRVEYRVSAFTSQEHLGRYLLPRCAEPTLREGYDFFHLAQREDVLGLLVRGVVHLPHRNRHHAVPMSPPSLRTP